MGQIPVTPTINVILFLATVASLLVAVVAIVLSMVFFRWSSQLTEGTREAAREIGASVDRLEKLFDKLYADTFSMTRDVVTDMRRHMWPQDGADEAKLAEEAERRADEKIEEVKKASEQELSKILERVQVTDGRVDEVREEMRALLDKAMSTSRQIESEARTETVKQAVVRQLREGYESHGAPTLKGLAQSLPSFSADQIARVLFHLKGRGLITWPSEEGIHVNDPIAPTSHPDSWQTE